MNNWRWRKRLRRGLSLWLLLGLFLCGGAVLVATNSVLMFGRFRGHLGRVCSAAATAYGHGGVEELRARLAEMDFPPDLALRLLDSSGRDVATGIAHPNLVSESVSLPVLIYSNRPMLISQGTAFTCVAEPLRSALQHPFGPMTWVLPFISLLCLTVGTYITWRMRQIETALNHFAEGELAVRMGSDAGDAIGRLSQAFDRMAERIESLVASHQTLCESMAHELRSPLTRLLLAIPRARRSTAGALDQIELEASRINELVDQLLEVARAEVDPSALQIESVDIQYLLTEIANRCEVEAAARHCEVELKLQECCTITADADLLRRAIENVLRNAVHHTPEGTRIEIAAASDANFATISVRDWGPGVPKGALTDIFKPFYRAGAARDRTSGGTGLGLAIAQRAVAIHRGTILADNCSPGLRVTIQLPRHCRLGEEY